MQIFGFVVRYYDSDTCDYYECKGLVAAHSMGEAADVIAGLNTPDGLELDMLTIQIINGAENGVFKIKDCVSLDDLYEMQDA